MRRLLPRGARFRIAVIERIFLAAQIFHTHQGRQMLEALVDPRQVFLCPALVAPFSSTVVSKRTLSQGPLAQLPPALWTPLVDPADLQAEHAEAALEVPPPLVFCNATINAGPRRVR